LNSIDLFKAGIMFGVAVYFLIMERIVAN